MRKYLLMLSLGIIIFTGCKKNVTPPKPTPVKNNEHNNSDVNVSPTPIIKNESLGQVISTGDVVPHKGVFDWQQNDELIKSERATKMVVVKSKRVVVLFNAGGEALSRHRISLGDNPVGTKLKQGDEKTPEGIYSIRDIRGDPKYYKEILISYPNAEDRQRSRELGFNPGGGITFHAQVPWNWNGSGDDHTLSNDWTNGCMALTNHGMDTVLSMIDKNTIVEIRE